MSGSLGGQYAAPIVSSLGAAFQGTYISTGNGFVTFSFATEQTGFGLLWGSVDSFNHLSFSGGSSAVTEFSGNDLSLVNASGSQGYGGSEYVLFAGNFNTVVLSSDNNSFEAAEFSLPSPAPEPAFTSLLGTGIAILGSLLYRRTRKSSLGVV